MSLRIVPLSVRTVCVQGIVLGTVASLSLLMACSPDKLVGSADLPNQVVDPAQTESPQGALTTYFGTLTMLRKVMATQGRGYVLMSGQLSDELRAGVGAPLYSDAASSPDHRQYLDTYENTGASFMNPYATLQALRGQANQADGLLRDFPPDYAVQRRAHVLAVKGFAELLLAELYCSGIPLSTLDYKGDFTYRPGSPTDTVLTHAIALFDSALAIVGTDSVEILNLARVGKGRALLQLGKFEEAALAVVDVPPAYRYNLHYSAAAQAYGLSGYDVVGGFLGDREGLTGLPFVSERDARLPAYREDTASYFYPIASERRGMVAVIGDPSTITLASGVEAQLIRAEAALRRNDPAWLTVLNQLRTSCTSAGTCPTPAPAGLGGVDSLPPLDEVNYPTTVGKVDILFRERAYWLFLTGHRTGDLRRLIRLYQRDPDTVFPTGDYDGSVPSYGGDVNLPVPRVERERNPYYRGCINREA